MPAASRPTIIGLSTYGRNEDNRFHLPAEYVEAVRRAGALAFMIAPGETRHEDLFEIIDGLLLTGGGDVNPKLYGGTRVQANYNIDDERDSSELLLARQAMQAGLPTLAICRGMQILNVELGGTLHEHVPDVYGDMVAHRKPPHHPVVHTITVTEDSRLFQIAGSTQFEAASWHHQALDRIAPGLREVGYTEDGLVEAIEVPDHPWFIGVQWHPEITAARDPIQQRLFDELVRVSRERTR